MKESSGCARTKILSVFSVEEKGGRTFRHFITRLSRVSYLLTFVDREAVGGVRRKERKRACIRLQFLFLPSSSLSLSRAPYLQVETSAEGVQQLKRETEEGGKIGRKEKKKEEKRRRRKKKKKGTCSRGTERAESVASSLLPSFITTGELLSGTSAGHK